MAFTRQLTSTEKIYIASDHVSPPCVNQFILEGTGELDKKEWFAAISKVGEVNPGSRLVMKGSLCFGHWVDSGRPPGLTEVDGSSWSGYSPENAPFMLKPLYAEKGPTCEVVLIKGKPLRIAFRSHHAVMDGMGTILWMQDIFRALRGQTLVGYPSRLTEYRLAKSFQKHGRTPAPHHFPAITGKTVGDEAGWRWLRVTVNGKIRQILPKVAWILANEIWLSNYPDCPVRFAVPVNMRPRGNNIHSTGNLSNLIYLDVTPRSTPETITEDLKTQLAKKSDGMLYWCDRLVRYFPLAIIENSLKKEIKAKHNTGLYRNSGIISNVGIIPLEQFTGGGFVTTNIFGLPIGMENIPFFLGIIGSTDHIDLIMGMAKKLAYGGRLEKTLLRVSSQLSNV
ncbi:MAG TPA: hypothetical protein PKN87_03245 [Syntrophomonadaceae bacterium]|nr:hypothetical protein [Syntrophomonadaceae bacterium]